MTRSGCADDRTSVFITEDGTQLFSNIFWDVEFGDGAMSPRSFFTVPTWCFEGNIQIYSFLVDSRNPYRKEKHLYTFFIRHCFSVIVVASTTDTVKISLLQPVAEAEMPCLLRNMKDASARRSFDLGMLVLDSLQLVPLEDLFGI
jgi:hypothetical protein